MTTDLNNRKIVVLSALVVAEKGLTPDEFVTDRGWYINSWAPSFTHLKQDGLTEWTGDRRKTEAGALANVHRITERGRRALAAAGEAI